MRKTFTALAVVAALAVGLGASTTTHADAGARLKTPITHSARL